MCVRVTSVPNRDRAAFAHHSRTGSALPFSSTGSSSSNSKIEAVASWVVSPTAIPLTGATPCSREAVFTTSPVTNPSPCSGRAPSETTASPVLMPIRTLRSRAGSSALASAIASRIRSPARIARSASSSWASGAPKTAITASPMNFSTVPP